MRPVTCTAKMRRTLLQYPPWMFATTLPWTSLTVTEKAFEAKLAEQSATEEQLMNNEGGVPEQALGLPW